ncbi:threonylcarbamoyl-AMP synthase [Candidatus Daviesbacteria bacterium]|nr:threonylcarbamoyl-AMP synthase [Candidatus Daviesbacteria bacterium]
MKIISQKDLSDKSFQFITQTLRTGGLVVMPTDTIYGIHASVNLKSAIEKIYSLRKRDLSKPLIILIAEINQIKKFGIKINHQTKNFLNKIWPNPATIIFPCQNQKYLYLHRDQNSLAFRNPKNKFLLDLIKEVGPVVSTSVNLAGQKPAETIKEALNYFGNQIDIYIDAGKISSTPSTIIEFKDRNFKVIREGVINIQKLIQEQ